MYRTVFCVLYKKGEEAGVMIWENGIETYIISFMKKSPVQVRCRVQDACGWCTEMTQKDGTGREEGGGFRTGNTCTPEVDSC